MKSENVAEIYELGARTIHSLWDENTGSLFHRRNTIRGKALDAVVWSGLGEDVRDPKEVWGGEDAK